MVSPMSETKPHMVILELWLPALPGVFQRVSAILTMTAMSIFKPEDDKKFYLDIPDPDFSPARNKAVVQETIKKYNAMQKKKGVEHRDAYMERSDAVISYLRHTEKKPGYDMLRYFDKSYLTFLRGDDIRRELMARMQIFDENNNLIKLNL